MVQELYLKIMFIMRHLVELGPCKIHIPFCLFFSLVDSSFPFRTVEPDYNGIKALLIASCDDDWMQSIAIT